MPEVERRNFLNTLMGIGFLTTIVGFFAPIVAYLRPLKNKARMVLPTLVPAIKISTKMDGNGTAHCDWHFNFSATNLGPISGATPKGQALRNTNRFNLSHPYPHPWNPWKKF